MTDAFRHLHMPPELACEFLAAFSRMEYALKAGGFAFGGENGIEPAWDRFANEIDDAFGKIDDPAFKEAVDFLLSMPPRRQIKKNGAIDFDDRTIDKSQTRAQQTLLMVRAVRNNLFHGAKHLPSGEREAGRNEALVAHSLAVLKACVPLHEAVRRHFEQ